MRVNACVNARVRKCARACRPGGHERRVLLRLLLPELRQRVPFQNPLQRVRVGGSWSEGEGDGEGWDEVRVVVSISLVCVCVCPEPQP